MRKTLRGSSRIVCKTGAAVSIIGNGKPSEKITSPGVQVALSRDVILALGVNVNDPVASIGFEVSDDATCLSLFNLELEHAKQQRSFNKSNPKGSESVWRAAVQFNSENFRHMREQGERVSAMPVRWSKARVGVVQLELPAIFHVVQPAPEPEAAEGDPVQPAAPEEAVSKVQAKMRIVHACIADCEFATAARLLGEAANLMESIA